MFTDYFITLAGLISYLRNLRAKELELEVSIPLSTACVMAALSVCTCFLAPLLAIHIYIFERTIYLLTNINAVIRTRLTE